MEPTQSLHSLVKQEECEGDSKRISSISDLKPLQKVTKALGLVSAATLEC